jgi:hypothetical protein
MFPSTCPCEAPPTAPPDKQFSKQFEELIGPILDRVLVPVERALRAAAEGGGDVKIDVVEAVGGATRLRALRERLANAAGCDVGHFLNSNDAVATGCALQAAALSQSVLSRAYATHEVVALGVDATLVGADGAAVATVAVARPLERLVFGARRRVTFEGVPPNARIVIAYDAATAAQLPADVPKTIRRGGGG